MRIIIFVALLFLGFAVGNAVFKDFTLFSIYFCTSIILLAIAYVINEVEN